MGEYLLGWVQAANLPPLVTTSPVGTPQNVAGVLGEPTTRARFGGHVNDRVRSGARFSGGYWFTRDLGIEAGVMMLESQSTFFSATSDTDPILARPFTNALTGAPEAVLVAFPGSSTGAIDIHARSGNFYEGHLDFTAAICDCEWVQLTALLGYRFYRYDEGLIIRQAVFPTGPLFIPGTSILSVDDFGTQNEFHGLDMGWRVRFLWQNLSADFLAKLAIGHISRNVNISGSQVTSVPGVPPVTAAAGVFALSSNIGRHSESDWALVPELGVGVGWQVRPNLWLRFGYSALLLAQAARAGEQIDLTLNPNLFPPPMGPADPSRPTFSLNRGEVWIQTLNFGVEFTF